MNGKKWNEGVLRGCIKKGFTKGDFIKEFQMKDENELKEMLKRIYRFEDVSITKRLAEMDQNEKHKGSNRKNKSKKQNNNNAVAAFVPVTSGMTVPYNVSNQQMLTTQLAAKLPALADSATDITDKLEVNSLTVNTVVETPTELQVLRDKLAANESYVRELKVKIAETNANYLKDMEWFTEIIKSIKNLAKELIEAKKLSKEKAESIENKLKLIAETNELLELANAESESLRSQIAALQAKKVYFGNCKEVQMDFDYLAENITVQDDAVIMKITNFFTQKDVSALISNFSGEQIRRLAEISNIVDIIKKEEAPDIGLELYFDESNDFTEMVALLTSCEVKLKSNTN